jgi:hypothetical protein
MGIFKNNKYLNPEKLKDVKLLAKIYNAGNRILLGLGIVFNGLVMIMMLFRSSPLFLFFLVNTYFLGMAWKGRKLKLP